MAKPYSYDLRCKVMAAIAQDGMKRVKPARSFRSVAIPSTVLRPGQKLVIDNATFHKGGRLESLVQAAGCEIQGDRIRFFTICEQVQRSETKP